MMQRRSRPIGITILAVFEILIGIVGLLASIALIELSALFATLPVIGGLVASIGLVIGGIALFFSLIWLATGVGFLRGRGWAWTLGMVFSVLSLLGAVGAFAIGLITGGIVGSFFWCLMLYYLTRSHVKLFFGKGAAQYNQSYPTALSPMPKFGQQQAVTSIPSYSQSHSQVESPSPASQGIASSNPIPQLGYASNNPGATSSVSGSKALVSCPYCGSRLTMGSPKCMTCGATIS